MLILNWIMSVPLDRSAACDIIDQNVTVSRLVGLIPVYLAASL